MYVLKSQRNSGSRWFTSWNSATDYLIFFANDFFFYLFCNVWIDMDNSPCCFDCLPLLIRCVSILPGHRSGFTCRQNKGSSTYF